VYSIAESWALQGGDAVELLETELRMTAFYSKVDVAYKACKGILKVRSAHDEERSAAT
jgi:hypothetical protein